MGGVITDLDGTIVQEEHGRILIPQQVELALKELYDLGRPLILNTLRFPLSIIRTFGKEWYSLSNSPIPTITLNGSQLGFVTRTDEGELLFEEIDSFPLRPEEIDGVLKGVKELLDNGVEDLLVFYYPKDWRMGEIIWTLRPENVQAVKEKYTSASSITAVEFEKLRAQLHAEEICLIFLLINLPQDQLMAYQHTRRDNFFTRHQVDKLFGAREMARRLGLQLSDCIGAGDTEMDRFLEDVGLSILVGNNNLSFRGSHHTIRIKNALELGDLLFRAAAIQREIIHVQNGIQ